MPTYDYRCDGCGKTFEHFQSMCDDLLYECEKCGGTLKRLVGGGLGIIFKGSGYYVTDNKSKPGSNNPKTPTSTDKPGKSNSLPPKKAEPTKGVVSTT